MRLQLKAALCAATLVLASEAVAQQQPLQTRRQHSGVSYAAPGASGYVDLSEDSASGAGFYPLPPQYRGRGAQLQHKSPPQYAGEGNAIGTAMRSEAIEYDFDPGYVFGNSHGVFDPVDGVGTPFSGGYYD